MDTLIVHFDFNRSTITSVAANKLSGIVQAHQSKKLQHIILYGHCDFKGSDGYNDSLSEARILSVRQFLITKGIPDSLFQYTTAFGERKPVADGTSDKARALNRRVELITWEGPDPVAVAAPVEVAADTTTKPKEPARPVEDNRGLTERINDSATKKGSNIVLENLLFVGGRHKLLPQSIPVLEELVQIMKTNRNLRIEIQGYICCLPDDQDGMDHDLGTFDLSVQRAKAIYEYLVDKGIYPSRLRYRGFGGSRKPFPEEKDEYERSRNRRVELKILNK